MSRIPEEKITTKGDAPGRERLVGRRILVVGAGQQDAPSNGDPDAVGNGRAISLLLAREGAQVACADLDLKRAQATVDLIEKEGGRGIALEGDVSSNADVQRVIAGASEALAGLDGLVLNVGVAMGGSLQETELEDLERSMRINVGGQFLGLKHGLPALERGGSIVMISAIAALRVGPTPLPYDASKAALAPVLRHGALTGEQHGIRVNMVMPGAIATPMEQHAFGGIAELPWGREGTAWEVAHATVFLLSDEASYVNGANLVVDGGFTAIH